MYPSSIFFFADSNKVLTFLASQLLVSFVWPGLSKSATTQQKTSITTSVSLILPSKRILRSSRLLDQPFAPFSKLGSQECLDLLPVEHLEDHMGARARWELPGMR